LKIVFLIRDPIERAWSHIRFRKPSVLGNLDAIKLFIDSDEQSLRGDYIKTIENYSSVFSSDNILLCFYDAIISDPQNLLSEVVLFLGGNTNRVKELSTLNNKSNVSKSLEMPIEVYEYLKGKYKKDINKMSSSIGSYSSIWLKKHYGVSNFEVEIKNSVKLNAVSI
jgi:hypothetical protein